MGIFSTDLKFSISLLLETRPKNCEGDFQDLIKPKENIPPHRNIWAVALNLRSMLLTARCGCCPACFSWGKKRKKKRLVRQVKAENNLIDKKNIR